MLFLCRQDTESLCLSLSLKMDPVRCCVHGITLDPKATALGDMGQLKQLWLSAFSAT